MASPGSRGTQAAGTIGAIGNTAPAVMHRATGDAGLNTGDGTGTQAIDWVLPIDGIKGESADKKMSISGESRLDVILGIEGIIGGSGHGDPIPAAGRVDPAASVTGGASDVMADAARSGGPTVTLVDGSSGGVGGAHDASVAGGNGGVWKTTSFLADEGAATEPCDPSFRGGVQVAAGDLDGDGRPDMIIGSRSAEGTVRSEGGSGGDAAAASIAKVGTGTLVFGGGQLPVGPISDVLYSAAGNSADSNGPEAPGGMLAAAAPVAHDSGIKVYVDVVYSHAAEAPPPVIGHGTSVLAWARVDGTAPTASVGPSAALAAPPDPAADVGTTVQGTNGDDIMWQTGAAWETLLGLGGNDVFVALADKQAPLQKDTWDGGAGTNWAHFSNVVTPVRVDLARYADRGEAQRAYEQPGGGYAYDAGISLHNIQNVIGSAHGDRIIGDAGANELWGHDGDDLLHGGAGDDVLVGGVGNDGLRGGPGNDWLEGGPGADIIRWEAGDLGHDTIVGFVLGQDSLAFGAGFLVTADPKHSLLVIGNATEATLRADTIGAGWQDLATFVGIGNKDLIAAINNGVLFGYQAGPLADGAPGGPCRPGPAGHRRRAGRRHGRRRRHRRWPDHHRRG